MRAKVHIVGAGMAGLGCAVALTAAGVPSVLHEAARRAGGRCRSFYDEQLDCLIDNGNHLILGANPAVFAYLDQVGARHRLLGQARAAFPFVDLRTGERWTLKPGASRLPWWIFSRARRIPGTDWPAYFGSALRLALAGRQKTVADCVGRSGSLVERLWEPLTVAILNAAIEEAAATLLWPVIKLTLGRGEAACRAYIAREGLGPDLVDPGIAFLEANGVTLLFNHRLRAVKRDARHVESLDFGDDSVSLGQHDRVVLALPPTVLHDLLPDVPAPVEARPIVNVHFRLPAPAPLPDGQHLIGLIGGTAQWLFVRGNLVSVTISAADRLVDDDADQIAARTWSDTAKALQIGQSDLPPHRVIKERRATFVQVPSALAMRPGSATQWHNLWLAGDWTATGLPATIEGALRSGQQAARLILAAPK
jgi:squalene-associated FAD-dependent desaturase